MVRVLFCLLISLSATQSFAYVTESSEPVEVTKSMSKWDRDFSKRAQSYVADNNLDESVEGYTECVEVVEIGSAFLCASLTQTTMNRALLRASEFVEGNGGHAGEVLPASAIDSSPMLYQIGGHDLRSADLKRFYDAMTEKCDEDKEYCFTSFEKDLWENFLLPKMDDRAEYVVITYAVQSGMSWQDVVTHEIMHAQYFLQPEYQKVVDEYWKTQLSDDEKSQIRRALSQYYDASNELLMINEFQAYILMVNAERSMLGGVVSKYRGPLLAELNAAGVEPVQVNK